MTFNSESNSFIAETSFSNYRGSLWRYTITIVSVCQYYFDSMAKKFPPFPVGGPESGPERQVFPLFPLVLWGGIVYNMGQVLVQPGAEAAP